MQKIHPVTKNGGTSQPAGQLPQEIPNYQASRPTPTPVVTETPPSVTTLDPSPQPVIQPTPNPDEIPF